MSTRLIVFMHCERTPAGLCVALEVRETRRRDSRSPLRCRSVPFSLTRGCKRVSSAVRNAPAVGGILPRPSRGLPGQLAKRALQFIVRHAIDFSASDEPTA